MEFLEPGTEIALTVHKKSIEGNPGGSLVASQEGTMVINHSDNTLNDSAVELAAPIYQFGDFCLDVGRGELWRGNERKLAAMVAYAANPKQNPPK